MTLRVWALAVVIVGSSTNTSHTDNDIPYLWQAELDGPIQKCGVPRRIRFVVADAIVAGEIKFGGKSYFPKGRIEDNREVSISLVRFYDDKKPLLSFAGKADGTSNVTWISRSKGCTGKARVLPRPLKMR